LRDRLWADEEISFINLLKDISSMSETREFDGASQKCLLGAAFEVNIASHNDKSVNGFKVFFLI